MSEDVTMEDFREDEAAAMLPKPGDADDSHTDDARIAEWLAETHLRSQYCWAERAFGWMEWDGRRWLAAPDEAVKETARLAFIKLLTDKATAGVDDLKRYAGLLSAGRIGSVVGLARGILRTDPAGFDQQPDLLNVANGVVDLRTGDLLAHDPTLLLTKVTNVDYIPEARHDDWQQALRALPPDVASWMQVRVGQAATGHMTPDDLMPICQGSGQNGKSTFFEGIMTALGEHATIVSERAIFANPDQHPTELMDLFGARFALIEETPEAGHLDVQRLKKTVGTPRIKARRIHRDPVEWKATHSLFITTNYTPYLNETDHGTWRRLALVKFPYVYKGKACDPGLRERLGQSEGKQAEAVLRWVVDGAKRWYTGGKKMPAFPAEVSTDTEAWREDADVVLAFIKERLTFERDAMVSTQDMLDEFNDWLTTTSRGQRAWTQKTFVPRFGDHEHVKRHGVVKTQTRSSTGVTRRSSGGVLRASAPLPAKPWVWKGVRWADDEP